MKAFALSSLAKFKESPTAKKAAAGLTAVVGLHFFCRWYLHSHSKGPFGYSTTAMQVVNGRDLSGQIVIVTGANTGLGYETARALHSKGAHVILACRNLHNAEAAKCHILDSNACGGVVECMKLDLNDLASVRAFASEFVQSHDNLHVLVNNAGIMGTPTFQKTKQGIEKQFGVNHLGHFYLAKLLTPTLRQSAPSRVLALASSAHNGAPAMHEWMSKMEEAVSGPLAADYSPAANYGFSKACDLLFAREFHRRHAAEGVAAVSIHPGIICTQLFTHVPAIAQWFLRVPGAYLLKNTESGAATSTLCAVMDHSQVDGHYFYDCTQNAQRVRADIREDEEGVAQRLWQVSERIIQKHGFSLLLD